VQDKTSTYVDVAVIGGGPAGISTSLGLSKEKKLSIALFESEAELGGMPRSCHIFFGLRDMKRIYTGPQYARKLNELIQETSVQIHKNATVLKVLPGKPGELHQLTVSSPEGLRKYNSRIVVLATGCYEKSREARRIPGGRPAGIFTTGSLQQIVNLQGLRPGKKAVVIGSEHVAFLSVITLRRAGVSVIGLVEEDQLLKTYPIAAKAISCFYRFPIYKGYEVGSILGKNRVEGVELVSTTRDGVLRLDCDTVVCTSNFRPDAALIYNTPIEQDPFTLGPSVDVDYMTTVPHIFAAGNILHGADMHDLCALEGEKAAQSILRILRSTKAEEQEFVYMSAESPIRYVVPQRILRSKIRQHRASWLSPGVAFQVASTVKRPTVEAWSGEERIWARSYSRLIARTRIPLPIEEFDWSRIGPGKSITLKMKDV